MHSADLPSGYEQLPALPFSGSDWIATDYCPAAGDRFECEVTVADAQPNASAAVFGSVRELEPERTFAFYVRKGGDDSSVVAYGGTARGGFFPRDWRVSLSVGPDGASWVWAGGSERLPLTPGFARDGVTPLMIGDANAASRADGILPAGLGTVMNLHRFRIWRGGLELVHDYVPCREETSQVVGVFDFCETAGKTPFRGLNMLSDIPYRMWKNAATVDAVCSNAFLVLPNTTVLKDNGWYFVRDVVSCGSITVEGSAHLILGAGAKLTASAISGGSLAVYGQPRGIGELTVAGDVTSSLTVEGGILSAGTLSGDSLTVVGGTMTVDSIKAKAVTIDGGNVKAEKMESEPKKEKVPLHCVKVDVAGLWFEKLSVGELGNYGTNDIYPIENFVYLWLPDGTHRFKLSDGQTRFRYCAVVKGHDVTVKPLPPILYIGFFVNGEDVGLRAGDGWTYGTNNVLSLDGLVPFVLSGEAMNNEVQVKAMMDGTTVVLSNAFVFAKGRPALEVEKSMLLRMAGDESWLGATNAVTPALGATNAAAAVSVATNAELTVDLAPGAEMLKSKIGVFSYGDTNAISGTGTVVVTGGTFFVQADKRAVGVSVKFAVGESELMLTGETPEKLKPAEKYDSAPCVLVVPAVTVTVKGVPNVTGFTVSNAVETITNFTGDATCRVRTGDDVFVGYAVREGYFSQSPNPLTYRSVTSNIVIGADAIATLPYLTCRAWDGSARQMKDCVCSNYTVVATNTAAFADGQWYAVTGTVSVADLTVNGVANLILCDGATLTAGAITNGTLTIYGQKGGRGILTVSGAVSTSLTIVGGNVKVDGSATPQPKNAMSNDVYRVTCEMSGEGGAKSGEVRVEGLEGYGIEKVSTIGGDVYLWLPDGTHQFKLSGGTATNRYFAVVNGKSVTAERLGPLGFFANGVDVGNAGDGDGWVYFGRTLSLTNATEYVLSGVATNDEVQVVATNDTARVVLSNAVVFASGRSAIKVAQTNLTVAAGQVMKTGNAPEELRYAQTYGNEYCVLAAPGVTVTVKDNQYVTGFTVSNAVETITNVAGPATCRMMAGDDVFVGYTVREGYFSQLPNPLVYTSVTNDVAVDADAIPTLPYLLYRVWDGTRTVDCVCSNYTVVATNTATFADGQWYAVTGTVSCSTITVNGAAKLILCDGMTLAAGAITNGVLAVYGQKGGRGVLTVSGAVNSELTIVGGNVKVGSATPQPKNVMSNVVYRVTAATGELGEERGGLSVEGLERYGIEKIRPIDKNAYLWLPDGMYHFTLSDGQANYRYCADVKGGAITVEPGVPVTPGAPLGPFATDEVATNVQKIAFVEPSAPVSEVLTSGPLRKTYCDMFALGVTGGGAVWFIEAALTPAAQTNLYATVTNATLQIPVAAIARLPEVSPMVQHLGIFTTNVTVNGCAPGFYYSLYDGWALTNIVADANATNLNVLCGADAKVTFPEVKKPSEKTGFFRVGVGVTDGVGK